MVLIGVADSVGELIREHRSVERALAQIHMPRMTRDELTEIVTRGMEAAQMTVKARRRRQDRRALPGAAALHPAALPARGAGGALGDAWSTWETRDVDAAVRRALDRAQQSVVEA